MADLSSINTLYQAASFLDERGMEIFNKYSPKILVAASSRDEETFRSLVEFLALELQVESAAGDWIDPSDGGKFMKILESV